MVTRTRQMTLLFNITQRTFSPDSNGTGGGGEEHLKILTYLNNSCLLRMIRNFPNLSKPTQLPIHIPRFVSKPFC